MSHVYIIGAGLAGLAAALTLSATGRSVTLYESAGHAGGRARSYHDDHLDIEIDNGNHLMLSGNWGAMGFISEIGAEDQISTSRHAAFPFVDLNDGSRWVVAPNLGRLPWWLFDGKRRVPGTKPGDYLAALSLRKAGPDRTLADIFDRDGPAFRKFWEPLAVAVLNTRAEEAAAHLLWPVLVETFGKGGAACRPCLARRGLSHAFAEPALETLRRRGVDIRLNTRLRAIEKTADLVTSLAFAEDKVRLYDDDQVVLAVPAAAAASLLPGITAPDEFRAIANAHFRLPDGAPLPRNLPFLGMIGGTAEWLFVRPPTISVTVSAAEHVIDMDAEELARLLWGDVARALRLDAHTLPEYRVVKEKRATFAATPDQIRRRPQTRIAWRNIFLAGDWTDTGLPATIEGAIRSGRRAALAILDPYQGR